MRGFSACSAVKLLARKVSHLFGGKTCKRVHIKQISNYCQFKFNEAMNKKAIDSPTTDQVKVARISAQEKHGIGITAAQDWCAAQLHTSRRAWQQWEHGDRAMHSAFWELFLIKNEKIKAEA